MEVDLIIQNSVRSRCYPLKELKYVYISRPFSEKVELGKIAPLPDNEEQRIKTLLQYKILDTPPEAAFDDITRIAAYICGTPIALVSLVDRNRQWFKSKVGVQISETPRDVAFCAHAICQSDVFTVSDATADARFATNPLVTGEPHLRFYAGVPLITPGGHTLGTLCVKDRVPRNLSPEQIEILRLLGRQVVKQLELRRNLAELSFVTTKRQQAHKQRQGFFQQIAIGFGLAGATVVLIGAVSYNTINRLILTNNQIIKTQERINALEAVLSQLKSAETGQRGYLLTGQQRYLEPYQIALTKINPEIEHLRQLATPNQLQQLNTLEPVINAKLAELKQTIYLRAHQGLPAALQLVMTNQGQQMMENIRRRVRQIQSEDNQLLQTQSAAAKASAHLTIFTLLLSTSLSFVILAGVYYLIYRQITERQAVENQLEQQRNLTSTVLDTARALVIVLDIEGRIVRFNHACEQLTGYSFDEVRNKHLWDLFLIPEEIELVKATFTELQTEKLANEQESYWVTRDGSRRLIAWANTVLHDHQGAIEYIIGTGIDITARRQAETELQHHNLQLQSFLAAETLQRQQLEVARRQAELASKTKSAFLANMSHEIRTPMNAVMGMTGLLLDTALNPQQRDFLETIRISGDLLLTLINEILDLSKLEAGEMELEILDFDLASCVEELLELLAPQAHAKGLEIAALVERNFTLQGDASRLRQVLMNLISNAIKFTSDGEVVVHAQVKTETANTVQIRFSVTDTGIGIAPEDQAKLFTPFTQVDASTSRKFGGTGLGLAICKQLVTLMDGEIGLESQLDKGSTFWFELSFPKQLQLITATKNPINLNARRLLVVDDNATNRKVVRHQVSRWGMHVDEASSGEAALDALNRAWEQRRPYDLALLDMQMPEMDGITLGRQIKANLAWAELPLIMLTSTNQRDEVNSALNLGFAAYLVKPIKASRLLDAIMSSLDHDEPSVATNSSIPHTLSTTPPLTTGNCSQSKLRILLAEDNLVNQKVGLKQLSSLGYEADVAANGQEVLQLLAKIPYDLVLMDCQMPVLDGLAATTEIRSAKHSFFAKGRPPIIVAMTADAMKEHQQLCFDVGMDDYLSKPVLKEKLAAVLDRWSKEILT